MISLEETVVRKLRTAQYILCTVESCTGGLLSNLITNVSGASEIYWGSFITYDNSSKNDLGVALEAIHQYGAVSLQVAKELAECGLKKVQSISQRRESYSLIKPREFICVATTGIAGPTGGSREKPVGLCFIGLAISGRPTLTEEFRVTPPQNRIQLKEQFAQKALELIRACV